MDQAAGRLGGAAHWISAGLLIATGAWTLAQSIRGNSEPVSAPGDHQRTWRLLVTGLAISIDNLAVGSALGAFHVSLALAAVTIGVISTGLSLICLTRTTKKASRERQAAKPADESDDALPATSQARQLRTRPGRLPRGIVPLPEGEAKLAVSCRAT